MRADIEFDLLIQYWTVWCFCSCEFIREVRGTCSAKTVATSTCSSAVKWARLSAAKTTKARNCGGKRRYRRCRRCRSRRWTRRARPPPSRGRSRCGRTPSSCSNWPVRQDRRRIWYRREDARASCTSRRWVPLTRRAARTTAKYLHRRLK